MVLHGDFSDPWVVSLCRGSTAKSLEDCRDGMVIVKGDELGSSLSEAVSSQELSNSKSS